VKRRYRYIRPCPVPRRQVGVGAEVEAAAFGPFVQELERILAGFAGWHRVQFVPVWRLKAQFPVN
jgi:hypothetical protein